ncbi:MAG: cyclic nucleotide-binding domain-containing protein [Nitrospinota bacterium]|nr:cyclic nucleotide-binding domain-containing protein [Nitrospinota bacterium]
MSPDNSSEDKAFKAKIEAMRKASKNPMASMTMKMQRFVEVSKEQAAAGKDDLSSTHVVMSAPKDLPPPKNIEQAKILANQMAAAQRAAAKTSSGPSTAKIPPAQPNNTGKFQKLVDTVKKQAGQKEDLSATQVIFLGARRNPEKPRPKRDEGEELLKKTFFKVVDIGGGGADLAKKKEEEELPVLKKVPSNVEDYDHETLMMVISSIPQFRSMTPPQVARLAKCEMKFWGPEEFVFREGGSNVDRMILILNGSVFVRKRLMKEGRERYEQIAEIKAPAIIGENSFFTGMGRSAGVYAKQRVGGIVITKDDLMRLVSLDKPAMIKLFGMIADENIMRCQNTADLYMNTLQLLWNQATKSNFTYTGRIKELDRKLDLVRGDIDKIQDLVRDVLITIRELNIMLEELYEFAHLPVITVQTADWANIKFPSTLQSMRVFHAVVEDLKMQSEFVSLNSINFKDVILNAVIRTQEAGIMVNYSAIVSLSKTAYNEFARRYQEMGFTIKFLSSEEASQLSKKEENTSLWDLSEPLFPGKK